MVRQMLWTLPLLIAFVSPPALADAPDHDPKSVDSVTGRPLYYLRELKKEELEDRTLRELSLMRNWIYARAGNIFRKDWLDQFFSAQPWYKPRKKQDLSILTEYDRKNAALLAKVEAAISDEELRERRARFVDALKRDPGYPHDPARPSDVIELGLIAARLGEWVEPKPGAGTTSPLEDPNRLSKLLKVKDLKNLSRRDLRILRNMVYARHGRPFKSIILQDYFAVMPWYQPDRGYTDARLTAVDKKNIKLIQSVEREIGGALSEHEHLVEEYGGDFLGAA